MTTKYHISPVTGKASVCHATKRACRYGTHYNSLAQAEKELTKTQIKELQKNIKGTPAPILVAPTRLREPSADTNLKYGYGVEWEDEDDYYSHSYNDYISHNPVVTGVDVAGVLASLYGCLPKDVPTEWVKEAEDLGFGNHDYYTAESEFNYYEDEVNIYAHQDVTSWAKSKYWALPNANDNYGVLNYVRGKGYDTTNLTPYQAVKAQLDDENRGHKSALVDGAKTARIESVPKSQIVVPAKVHLENVEPRPIKSPGEGIRNIAGVLVKRDGKYHLVDGYHRFKGTKDGKNTRYSYIVLE